MLLVLILLIAYLIYSLVFPIPYWPSFFRLFRYLFSSRLKLCSRLRLFRHLLSLSLYSFVGFIFLPADLAFYAYSRLFLPWKSPVFICGTPRSGSTLLHRLLIASSPELFGVTHLEWRLPSVTLQLLLSSFGLKHTLSLRNYWASSPVSEAVSRMHSASLGDYEEDAILFEERSGHHPYQYLHVPLDALNSKFSRGIHEGGVSSAFAESRLLFFFRFFVRSLSVVKRPALRFVSKEVASNQRLEGYYQHEPGAKFIVITRAPSSYLSSLKPLLDLSTQSKTSSSCHFASEDWWCGWYSWLVWQANLSAKFYTRYSRSGRVLHVRYEDLVSQPEVTLRHLLDFLDAPPSSDFQSFIDSFVRSQSARKRGYTYPSISYSPGDYEFFNDTFYP